MSERTIFKALSEVQADLAKVGIAKNDTNEFDRYKYRGIDAVLNTLAPILSERGILIFPSVKERDIQVFTTQKGGQQFLARITVDYTLYDSDGDSITHTAYGEAMDRGDKALNKALTAAYKYFVFQAFCIPLVGDDADAESHQITMSQEAQDAFDRMQAMLSDGDGIAFVKYLRGVGADVQEAAFSLAPSGTKTKFKQQVRELEQQGHASLDEYARILAEYVDADDDLGVKETIEELDGDARKLVAARMDKAVVTKLKEITQRTAA